MKTIARGQVEMTTAEKGESASALSFSPAVLNMQDRIPAGSQNWWSHYSVQMRVMKGGNNVTYWSSITSLVSDNQNVTFSSSKITQNNDTYFNITITSIGSSIVKTLTEGYFDVVVHTDTTVSGVPDTIEHSAWDDSYKYCYTVTHISDFDYLKEALPEEGLSTDITDGIVLSNIIGVRDSNDDVVAALNGLETTPGFYNQTHGTVMLATGIDDLGDSQNEVDSHTKIYSDGTIETDKLVASGSLETKTGNKGVTIAGNEINITNSDGDTCVNILGDSIGNPYGNSYPSQTLTWEQSDLHATKTSYSSTYTSSDTVTLTNIDYNTFLEIPSFHFDCKFKFNLAVFKTFADILGISDTISIYGYGVLKLGSQVIATSSNSATWIITAITTDTESLNLRADFPASQIIVPKTNTNPITFTLYCKFSTTVRHFDFGNVIDSFEFGPSANISVTVNKITQVIESVIGEDGFRTQLNSDTYFQAKIENTSASIEMKVGDNKLKLSRSGFEFESDNGLPGFRNPITKITANKTLTLTDHTIIANQTGLIMTLPTSPKDGQEYVIIPTVDITTSYNGLYADSSNKCIYVVWSNSWRAPGNPIIWNTMEAKTIVYCEDLEHTDNGTVYEGNWIIY